MGCVCLHTVIVKKDLYEHCLFLCNHDSHYVFVSLQMWDRLTTESNRYAAQQRTAHPPTPSTAAWRDFEKTDMQAFIGLCFSMGFLRFPRLHHYWRTMKWMLTTKFPSVMSRNKFDLMTLSNLISASTG